MLRKAKEAVVSDLKQEMEQCAGLLFLDFTGLTVAEADDLRHKAREGALRYVVVKNTLMKRALDGTSFADVSKCLKGTPTGVLFASEDPVAGPKLVCDVMKTCKHIQIKGGVVDNQAITPSEVEGLSKLPSRAEMQAGVVALALSPGRNVAGQIKNPAGRVVGAIEALVTKLES